MYFDLIMDHDNLNVSIFNITISKTYGYEPRLHSISIYWSLI